MDTRNSQFGTNIRESHTVLCHMRFEHTTLGAAENGVATASTIRPTVHSKLTMQIRILIY